MNTTTTTKAKKRTLVFHQNEKLIDRLRAAFETHKSERVCEHCGRGDRKLTNVALVHFVKLTREEVPAFLLTCPIGSEELSQLATRLEEEARYHAACFKTEQSYAVVCYAKDDAVLQQIRFTIAGASA